MERSLRVTPSEYQALLEQYRKGSDPRVRLRAHTVLLLAQGYSWAVIAGVLFCSTRTIARWKARVVEAGVAGVLGSQSHCQSQFGTWWSG
jgi:putative transposase